MLQGPVHSQEATGDDGPPVDRDLWDGPQPSEEAQPSEGSLCWQYMSSGFCVNGDICTMMHGDYCEVTETWGRLVVM